MLSELNVVDNCAFFFKKICNKQDLVQHQLDSTSEVETALSNEMYVCMFISDCSDCRGIITR